MTGFYFEPGHQREEPVPIKQPYAYKAGDKLFYCSIHGKDGQPGCRACYEALNRTAFANGGIVVTDEETEKILKGQGETDTGE